MRDRHDVELALRIALGAALIAGKGYAVQEVEENYVRALELGQQIDDSQTILTAMRGLWVCNFIRARPRQSPFLERGSAEDRQARGKPTKQQSRRCRGRATSSRHTGRWRRPCFTRVALPSRMITSSAASDCIIPACMVLWPKGTPSIPVSSCCRIGISPVVPRPSRQGAPIHRAGTLQRGGTTRIHLRWPSPGNSALTFVSISATSKGRGITPRGRWSFHRNTDFCIGSIRRPS